MSPSMSRSMSPAETATSSPDDGATRRPGPASIKWAGRWMRGLVGAGVVFGLAELLTRAGLVSSSYLPPASSILRETVGLFGEGEVRASLWSTIKACLIGLVLSVLVAVPAGLILGLSPIVHKATSTILEFLRPIPSVALIPLAIVLYGRGTELKVVLVIYACTLAILFNTIYGIRSVDPVATDTARVFGRQGQDRDARTSAQRRPVRYTGVKIASSIAVILVVSAELLAAAPPGPASGSSCSMLRRSATTACLRVDDRDRPHRLVLNLGFASASAGSSHGASRTGLVTPSSTTKCTFAMPASGWRRSRGDCDVVLLTARADCCSSRHPKGVHAVWDDWIRPFPTTWSENLRPSLTRLLAGYLIAAVLAIAAGVMIGRSRRLADYVEPVIDFVRAIPPPALLPLFLILLGIGDSMKVALIATGVFPPILLNSIDGVRSIDPLFIDTAKAFRIARLRRVTHVILPAATPKIFAGLRISSDRRDPEVISSSSPRPTASASGSCNRTAVQVRRPVGRSRHPRSHRCLAQRGLTIERKGVRWSGDERPRRSTGDCRSVSFLAANDLHHVFGPGTPQEHHALDGISLSVREGEFVSVVGPSGCGKTTLLRCLSGLMAPTAGTVTLHGERVTSVPKDLTLVFQDYGRALYPWLKVRANVDFPLRDAGLDKAERAERVGQALADVGLEADAEKYRGNSGRHAAAGRDRPRARVSPAMCDGRPYASVDAQTRPRSGHSAVGRATGVRRSVLTTTSTRALPRGPGDRVVQVAGERRCRSRSTSTTA